MSNRKVRVGELIKREISDILHTRFQGRSVMITITDVDVSPDNKNARVLYSVVETDGRQGLHAKRLLENNRSLFQRELSKRIILKYLPTLEFVFDEANQAANRVNALLDSLDLPALPPTDGAEAEEDEESDVLDVEEEGEDEDDAGIADGDEDGEGRGR